MKELITEEQANLIVLFLSAAVSVISLAFAAYRNSNVQKSQKKIFWVNAVLCALVGPVIWIFWQVYNSIENYYGLDSLKALEINFFISVGIGLVFFGLFSFAPRWIQPQAHSAPPGRASRRRK